MKAFGALGVLALIALAGCSGHPAPTLPASSSSSSSAASSASNTTAPHAPAMNASTTDTVYFLQPTAASLTSPNGTAVEVALPDARSGGLGWSLRLNASADLVSVTAHFTVRLKQAVASSGEPFEFGFFKQGSDVGSTVYFAGNPLPGVLQPGDYALDFSGQVFLEKDDHFAPGETMEFFFQAKNVVAPAPDSMVLLVGAAAPPASATIVGLHQPAPG